MNKDCMFRDCHATDRVLLYNHLAGALERVLRDEVEGFSVLCRWGPNQCILSILALTVLINHGRGISC